MVFIVKMFYVIIHELQKKKINLRLIDDNTLKYNFFFIVITLARL